MAGPAFAQDIKPLFREKDRNSMIGRFDLWSYQDVHDNASGILAVPRSGTGPRSCSPTMHSSRSRPSSPGTPFASRLVRIRELEELPRRLWPLRLRVPLVTFRRNDQLGEIVIDSPPHNLFSGDLLADLPAAVNEAAGTEIRALLVRAEVRPSPLIRARSPRSTSR
jgi:hypothetical protein